MCAIDRESKRKTAAVVSLRNGDRLFGDPALNTVGKTTERGWLCLCMGEEGSGRGGPQEEV